MAINIITKYDYHYYVFFIVFILGITATYALCFLNFSATESVNRYALFIAIMAYGAILLYFYSLSTTQQWIMPKKWTNFQKHPLLYCLVIFPIVFIPVVWLNFSKIIPMTYTKIFGIHTTEVVQAPTKKSTYKGNTRYCFYNKYACLPIFKIDHQTFDQYQNQNVLLHITTQTSSLGTIIHTIEQIQVSENNSPQ